MTAAAAALQARLRHKVYPSVRFSLTLDDSPSLIGATAFTNATGDTGQGVKIAVVDDGIDQTSTFFDPSGFSYPAGFPRGQTEYTTPKVIVARVVPRPGLGQARRGCRSIRRASFHGTHVAGIAAGDAGTTAPAGPDHPRGHGLSGVAPRAWLGNYRVFNAPTPAGNSAFTPQIVAAFEDAVADGMDVINFSGGGPMNDPRERRARRGGAQRRRGRRRAGDLRRERPRRLRARQRRRAGHGARRDQRRRRLEHPRLRPGADGLRPGGRGADPDQPRRRARRRAVVGRATDQKLVDVGTIVGTDGKPVDRYLCGPADEPRGAGRARCPPGSLDGAIALVSPRLLHVRVEGRPREGGRARSGSSSSTTGPARRTASRIASRRSRPG